MSNELILVADDDQNIRNACAESMKMEGYKVLTAASGEEALGIIKKTFCNIVLSDLKMPGMDGMALLKQIKKMSPATEVILFTSYGTVETAVEAMKIGAYDFVTKPIDLAELDLMIIRCLEKQRLLVEVGEFKELVNLYEASRAMSSVMKLPQLLDFIVKLACEALIADGGSIMLLNKETNELEVKASTGLRGDLVLDKKIKLGERVAGYVALENQPVLIDGDIKNDTRFTGLEGFDGIKSGLSAPLTRKNQVIGVINLNRMDAEKKFTKRDLNLLSIFTSQAAIAIENTILFSALEGEKEKIQAVFSGMRDGAILTDNKFRIIMLNQSAETLLNLKKENCISLSAGRPGKNLFECIPDIKPSVKIDENIVDFDLTREKGKLLTLSVLMTKILDENKNITGYIFVLRDVTNERKEEKIKRNFIDFISHKLRTPLTGITGYFSILQKQETFKKLNAAEKKAFEIIEKEAQELSGLIDKLLRFSSVETDSLGLNREKINLTELIKECIKNIPVTPGSGISINVSPMFGSLPPVSGDKTRIMQVFQNLITNGIKFNENSEKNIEISGMRMGEFIQICVVDNGDGIPSEEIPKLFQKFYQIEESFTGQVEGAGLGLALVKRIVGEHGGKVWAESEVGKGSRFYFTLAI
ncbi:MAG: response regulator [Elusimicrobia bacterium]|nr:response regulator [Elusimicrobiota bacterium]